ncbi:MAG TPA: WxcM-like domain-containing protein [Dehalococcoidia bacterium]|nr:WxcM-like domain-containing protein [Dehalococcoidia bacterium]
MQITPLLRIPDERGYVMHMLRADSPVYRGFGEVYFSVVYPGVVKGWHRHRDCTLNYTAVSGMVKVVLYDERQASATKGEVMEIFIGDQNYQLVTVPRGIWNGIKGTGTKEATMAVFMDAPYDQAEFERLDPFENHIPYDWSLRNE